MSLVATLLLDLRLLKFSDDIRDLPDPNPNVNEVWVARSCKILETNLEIVLNVVPTAKRFVEYLDNRLLPTLISSARLPVPEFHFLMELSVGNTIDNFPACKFVGDSTFRSYCPCDDLHIPFDCSHWI